MFGLVKKATLERREAEMGQAIWNLRREKSELATMREQEQVERGQAVIRVGVKRFDALSLQAQCRTVVPAFTIQPMQDGQVVDWIFYANRQLIQAEVNGLEAILGFEMDKS